VLGFSVIRATRSAPHEENTVFGATLRRVV